MILFSGIESVWLSSGGIAMFCHYCGRKLVNGARFCSRCGTPVPSEIVEEMEQEPVSAVTGITEEQADLAADDAPISVKKPVPEPSIDPKPVPDPESVPAPKPAPEPETKSKPEPETVSAPMPGTDPAPDPEPVARLSEEKIILPITVSADQVQREETVVLKHEAMLEPMQLTLRRGMKDGMRLRLTNARMKPSSEGAVRLLVLEVHVQEMAGPAGEPAEKQQDQVSSEKIPPTEPAQQNPDLGPEKTIPARQDPARRTVSFAPATAGCAFQLCREGELRTGHKLTGADEMGTIEISPSALTVYRKSKAVAASFGMIGNMIEGKGKYLATISPEMVASHEKAQRNRRLLDYLIHLKDGRLLKICFDSSHMKTEISALEQFLTQV